MFKCLHNQYCINIINSISDFCCNSKGPVISEICATILGDLSNFQPRLSFNLLDQAEIVS